MTPIDSSSFALPYTPDIDIRPRPSADAFSPLFPTGRCSMDPSLVLEREFDGFLLRFHPDVVEQQVAPHARLAERLDAVKRIGGLHESEQGVRHVGHGLHALELAEIVV